MGISANPSHPVKASVVLRLSRLSNDNPSTHFPNTIFPAVTAVQCEIILGLETRERVASSVYLLCASHLTNLTLHSSSRGPTSQYRALMAAVKASDCCVGRALRVHACIKLSPASALDHKAGKTFSAKCGRWKPVTRSIDVRRLTS